MSDLVERVARLIESIDDPRFAAEIIIDVVARGLGKLGGRPAKEPTQAHCAPVATPVDADTQAGNSIKSEVSEPLLSAAKTSNSSDLKSGSALSLFSPPDPIQKSSSDRRFNEPLPPGFADFWALYPRRVGKGDAIKSWVKQTPPVDLVRTAVIWQVEAWDAESPPRPIEKIPHPATWLNGKRWLDEKPAPRKPAIHPKDQAAYDLVKGGFPGK